MSFKLIRKTAIGVKTESTQGTAVSPAFATDLILLQAGDVTQIVNQLDRNVYRSSLGTLATVPGVTTAQVKLTTELKYNSATGSVYTPLDTLFLACGFSSSYFGGTASYAPISDAPSQMIGPAKSCTIDIYRDGIKQTIAGCVGTWKLTGNAGQFGTIEFTMNGTYSEPVDTGSMPPSNTLNNTTPPIIQNSALNMQGYTGSVVGMFEVDAGNQIELIMDVNSPLGAYGYAIVDRKPVGSFTPMAPTVSTHNFIGKLVSGSNAAGHVQVGSGVTQSIELNFANVQYQNVTYTDTNKFLGLTVPLSFNDIAGNDWCTILMH